MSVQHNFCYCLLQQVTMNQEFYSYHKKHSLWCCSLCSSSARKNKSKFKRKLRSFQLFLSTALSQLFDISLKRIMDLNYLSKWINGSILEMQNFAYRWGNSLSPPVLFITCRTAPLILLRYNETI